MIIRTVKDLREIIKNLPDDFPIGGYNGKEYPDYYIVDASVVNRADDDDWEEIFAHERKEMEEWWADSLGYVPINILVFDVCD